MLFLEKLTCILPFEIESDYINLVVPSEKVFPK